MLEYLYSAISNLNMEKIIVFGISSVTAALFLLAYCRVFTKSRKRDKQAVIRIKKSDLWNTALFFPDYFPEEGETTTKQLIWYLEQATSTIEVCVYGFAFPMLENVLIRLAKKDKVAIRIITNKPKPRRRSLQRAGVHCRSKKHIWKSPHDANFFVDLMHHKFVIIDGSAALVGSLNWTWASISENNENVLVTTHPNIVGKLSQEFELQWKEAASQPPVIGVHEQEKWINGERRGVREAC